MCLSQLVMHAQYSTDLQNLRGWVVGAENHHDHHVSYNGVVVFFSLALTLPVVVILLGLVFVYGAFPYIRNYTNNEKVYPCVAALYWIGQTVTFCVIVMDLLAFSENYKHPNALQKYQLVFLLLVTVAEIISLILSFVAVLIILSSHYKNTHCKDNFESFF